MNDMEEMFDYEEVKPPLGVEVIAYSEFWKTEINSKGLRIGFQNEDEENGPFVTAVWNDYHDFYETVYSDDEDVEFGKPQKWKFIG